jgi:mono/diheme cytochrome c family protein
MFMIRNHRRASTCAGLLLTGTVLFGVLSLGADKPGDKEKGKDTFNSNCSACHYSASTEELVGPGLQGLFKKAALKNKKKVTDENVLDIINKGSPVGMPGFGDGLSSQEKADVLAYLKTL